ncbi:hypothetical protein CsatA_023351 [Cannabis sativa]
MAKTKNAQLSKKPSRGSTSASPITPPVPPALVTGVPGLSSAPTKSARKSKTQAQKSVINLASPPVIASPTPGFGDHDESHSSDHTLSKSSSSNGAPNVDKAMVTLPMVSSRTRSKVSTPQKPKVVQPKNVSKGKKVVSSSSKAKNLKENPPSVSSSNSEPEEEIEEDHDSKGLSDSSEAFVPKDQPSVADSASESEEPEAEKKETLWDVAEALNLPMGIETTDVEFDRQKVFGYLTGDNDVELSNTMHMSQLTYQHAFLMRLALSNWFPCSNPLNILSDQEKLILENESIEMPAVGTTFKIPEKPPQGKTAQRKARSASPGITNDATAAFASTSAPIEMAEFNLHLGRMETSQALLLRNMDSIMKYYRPNDDK